MLDLSKLAKKMRQALATMTFFKISLTRFRDLGVLFAVLGNESLKQNIFITLTSKIT